MQNAVSPALSENLIESFSPDRSLPEEISFLNTLSQNFYWSWNESCERLFADIEPGLWDRTEQNPRLFLRDVAERRLWEKAADRRYLKRLHRAQAEFENYMLAERKEFGETNASRPIAYFCAEYGVHNSLPIYSGGLGILAGDHLKSASDLNLPLIAVGLMYRFGYFRQSITHDGWQEEKYTDSFDTERALTPVLNADGDRVKIGVRIRGREVFAQAWLAKVGRVSLYLLDTNVSENDAVDRYITGHLYGGDSETRIVQEEILGIGGVRLLRKLNIEPSVFHLNEGHSAFLTLELAREHIASNPEASFLDAIASISEKCVFTTHTPVEAGNDTFDPDVLLSCLSEEFINDLKLDSKTFLDLGRTNPEDDKEWFGMTPLAIRLTRSANGVSKKHGEVSRKLWRKMFPEETPVESVPIASITNGVHALTWISPIFKEVFQRHIGDDWETILRENKLWSEAVGAIPDEEIWNAHLLAKRLLIAFIRERTQESHTGDEHTINEHKRTSTLFDPNVLTIGFARRIAAYKRWNLIISDLDRLLKMVDHPDRPVQFVFAGKAHPQDRKAKNILQHLLRIDNDSNWQKRAVFIADYDQEIARHLVQGVDVWMNVPRRPLEASGTSGQKVAMNGGLNFSILDGWWIEGYNGKNGFAIGPREDPENLSVEELDDLDAESLYSVLENEIIPRYYDLDENGLPAGWIASMKDSLATLTHSFGSDRMVEDYLHKIYLK